MVSTAFIYLYQKCTDARTDALRNCVYSNVRATEHGRSWRALTHGPRKFLPYAAVAMQTWEV